MELVERVELLEKIVDGLIDALKREQEISVRIIEVQKKIIELASEQDY